MTERYGSVCLCRPAISKKHFSRNSPDVLTENSNGAVTSRLRDQLITFRKDQARLATYGRADPPIRTLVHFRI